MGRILALFTGVPPIVWKILAVAVIIGSIYGAGYIKGGSAARAACEEKARQAQIGANKQDKKADDQVRQGEVQVDVTMQELAKKQAARIKELEGNATVTTPSCVYPMPAPSKQPARGVRAQPAKS